MFAGGDRTDSNLYIPHLVGRVRYDHSECKVSNPAASATQTARNGNSRTCLRARQASDYARAETITHSAPALDIGLDFKAERET